MKLTDFKALTFDVYGTLIDWETGMVNGLADLVAKVDRVLSRDEILEAHARHESSQQAYTPAKKYSEILEIVYKRLAEEWGVVYSREECIAYGNSVKDWPAFPDSEGALQHLKKHYKLIVLTNTDNDSFKASNEKLGVEFDGRYTAEDVGSYKPADRNFDYMLEKMKTLGLEKSDILHTAESMFHDHAPANKYGLTNCWIYRRHDQKGFGATMNPGEMPSYKFRFNSMADLVKAHQEELRG
ncbi:haloacid dehalogenase type II [Natronohydrobacter thiooxidans]|uniref:haloacid dehalogenase type II n=1 Tax=Natronohydrobacter thiooxidans TaxID=87172 RepID=UPI0008FF33F3|nr:haloacid dehalogenase type II [Natronohydrobacter thiooxidans]